MKIGNRYANTYPHPGIGFGKILRWKLGLGPEEAYATSDVAEPPYVPQFSTPGNLGQPVADRLQVTWIGHSTFLIQYRGRNILTDPIFGNCQPLPVAKLRRLAPPGVAFDALPKIDDVLISHSHYDHLDAPTISRLDPGMNYWLPSGLAPWFDRRDIKRSRELAWWESAMIGDGLELHSVPAQHFSGRTPFDRDRSHWCGWVLRSAERTLYFAGDTGYSQIFRDIGNRFGGFDLSIIPIGACKPRWIMGPIHVDPSEAVQIHRDVRSRQSIACHWGTFNLADEPPGESPLALEEALVEQGVPRDDFRTLRFGETIIV